MVHTAQCCASLTSSSARGAAAHIGIGSSSSSDTVCTCNTHTTQDALSPASHSWSFKLFIRPSTECLPFLFFQKFSHYFPLPRLEASPATTMETIIMEQSPTDTTNQNGQKANDSPSVTLTLRMIMQGKVGVLFTISLLLFTTRTHSCSQDHWLADEYADFTPLRENHHIY